MLMRFHSLLFFFLTVTNTLDVEAIVARLQTRYHSVRTLQAMFLERYRENGRVVRVEAGTAYFRRPGKMRWDYQAPEKNVFLVDGNTAWFYVPADHTATRVPAKERDRKSTRLNSSHQIISYAVFCLKKKKNNTA